MAEKKIGKKVSNSFMWIVIGLAMVGMLGFGATSFSGGVQSVASVGDEEVDVNDYARGLDRALNSLSQQLGTSVTLAQAENFGIQAQVLSQLLTTAALDNETNVRGISAGDDRVARAIREVTAFQNISGQFDPAIYRSSLDRNGLSVADFESDMRDDVSRNILQAGIIGGIQGSDTAARSVLNFLETSHDFTFLTLSPESLPEPIDPPAEDIVRSYFNDNADRYLRPETRDITYVSLTPAMLSQSIDVNEDDLRAAYDARADEFNRPARRIVERLIYQSDEDAQAALALIESGETTFEALVEERGLTLADVDLGDVTEEGLGAAGPLVFDVASTGGVVVAPTDLGPSIFRVNAILFAQVTEFDDVRDQLRQEEALDLAERQIADLFTPADELLASGATLEELAEDLGFTLGQIAFSAESADEIAQDSDFRRVALENSVNDFPAIETLGNGGLFALRVNKVDEERPETFEEARQDAEADWVREETEAALELEAGYLADAWRAGAAAEDLGTEVVTERGLTRRTQQSAASPFVLQSVLEMDPGSVQVVTDGQSAYVVKLLLRREPDLADDNVAAQLQAVRRELAQAMAQDVFTTFTNEVQDAAGISLNQPAMQAVHAQFP